MLAFWDHFHYAFLLYFIFIVSLKMTDLELRIQLYKIHRSSISKLFCLCCRFPFSAIFSVFQIILGNFLIWTEDNLLVRFEEKARMVTAKTSERITVLGKYNHPRCFCALSILIAWSLLIEVGKHVSRESKDSKKNRAFLSAFTSNFKTAHMPWKFHWST